VAKTGKREWFWIDDDMPTEERLQHLGLDASRCVSVNSKGERELEVVKEKLILILQRAPVG
jgi:hypothetical protein